ncbi:MAG: hypothetical protein K0Q91_835 [Fibrobacteria bacterium]|jgi:hypothetical protein|nr:hypothetical protein [Fibrobacteria bacterium]
MNSLRQALALGALTALLTGCFTPASEDKPSEVIYALAAIRTISLDELDTALTTYTYDVHGRRVRERAGATVREWDTLGRYTGLRYLDSTSYLERVEWISADSTRRTQVGGMVYNDRFFNRRPNCWCADSIRHYIGGFLSATRHFTYDTDGYPLLVTLRWHSSSRLDTAQRFENSYPYVIASPGTIPRPRTLLHRMSLDAEAGDTTRQIFEYAPLDSLIEAR